jgi:hypothetical protein
VGKFFVVSRWIVRNSVTSTRSKQRKSEMRSKRLSRGRVALRCRSVFVYRQAQARMALKTGDSQFWRGRLFRDVALPEVWQFHYLGTTAVCISRHVEDGLKLYRTQFGFIRISQLGQYRVPDSRKSNAYGNMKCSTPTHPWSGTEIAAVLVLDEY